MLVLGIDVSKATLVSTLLDDAQQPQWQGTVSNSREGVRQLLQRTPPTSPWVVEPTGPYSMGVVRHAQAAGRTVLLAPTTSAKAFLRAISPRAKTDRVDSLGLARYAQAVALRPYPRPSETVETVDQLLAARKGISQRIARLRQQRTALPLAAAPLDAAIVGLQEHLRELDRQLAQQTADPSQWPAVAALQTIPGVGPVTAVTVAACFATHHFPHADQFVAYCGLDTQVRESGQYSGTRRLSKQGDAELRRLLYLCAQANLRSRDPANPFKQQYQRELAKGLATTAALVAVARKLARTCWSLATHGTTYDPDRVHRQPIPPAVHPTDPLDTEP
jgi:transposase